MTGQPWRTGRLLVAVACLLSLNALCRADQAADAEARLRRDIEFLASPECEGRGVNTKGINLAADYVAKEFEKAGLKPAKANAGYFQPFTMTGNAIRGEKNTLALRGPQGQVIEFKVGEHFAPVGLSSKGQVSAPVVFAGHGVSSEKLNYDDFRGLDVAGKVVILLRKTPRPENSLTPFDGGQAAFHAGLETKLVKADLQKAAAVLFVNDYTTARKADTLMEFGYTAASGSPAKVPVLHVRRGIVEPMFQSALGKTLLDVEADIDRTQQPQGRLLSGWTAMLDVGTHRPAIPVKNVIGIVEGSGKLANETVVIGAHYDHLGYGGGRDSLDPQRRITIHFGADDNGSGTTALLELARRFAGKPAQGDRRRLVFMAFSAEESGLLGSAHYCKSPLFPLEHTAAMLNLDMVGRLRPDTATKRDKLLVEGSGTAKHFDGLLDEFAKKHDFQLSKTAGGNGPSDHASFYSKKIPVIFYWTGTHPDYHRPSDTADKINIAGMRKIVQLAEETATHLATRVERPEYVHIAPRLFGGGMRAGGPRLGVMPNYNDEKDGVLLDGVTAGGAAAKAGMLEGDRILTMGGKPVRNVNTYMVLMGAQKKGDTLEIEIERKGEKKTVKVVLE